MPEHCIHAEQLGMKDYGCGQVHVCRPAHPRRQSKTSPDPHNLLQHQSNTTLMTEAGTSSSRRTWGMVRSEESGIPGSAGTCSITVADSTAMTPTGVPPSLARPASVVQVQSG